jgi:hypothetical protein
MSEKLTMLGGTPIVRLNDAIDFFAQRTGQPCPACGHTKWGVIATSPATTNSEVEISLGILGMDIGTGKTSPAGLPLVVATCKKCAYLRMHGMVEISKWIAAGKPDFKEEDDA